MFRYDRFNAEVKRVGKKNVIDGLFNGGANSSPNNYMKDGSNPSCDKIEAFCRFFGRPVSFFVDLSDGKDDGKDFGNDFDMSLFRECYCGKFDSETDFAEEIVNSCYDLDRLMGDLSRYFNYEAFADELFAYDYAMGDNGYVFRR